jgi:hypothetical protein
MDNDTPFGSDIKPLHRLLDLEKNTAGRKEEEKGTSTNQVHAPHFYYLP